MLLLVTGSSCSGKTTAARGCLDLPDLDVHDSDEHGVPSSADAAWRQCDLEMWLQLALDADAAGRDLLLTGQSPLGELLAAPSAPQLDLAVCLLDVADRDRWIRLGRRDPDTWTDEHKRAFVGWARWHRSHVADPHASPEVLTTDAWPKMRWDRWESWTADDPRWNVHTIDSTGRTPEQTGSDLHGWVVSARAARTARTLSLARGWDREQHH